MENYQLCPKCREKYLNYKKLMLQFKAKKLEKKPKKCTFCSICKAYLDMEQYFERFKGYVADGVNAGTYTNCISPCGYGMFAPTFYKEHVIERRRNNQSIPLTIIYINCK